MPNRCAPQVSMCRSWFYKVVTPPPRKVHQAIGDMLCGWLSSIAISWAKNEFKFLCKLGWFRRVTYTEGFCREPGGVMYV